MTAAHRASRGLLVGRFQPFHLGHLAVVGALRRLHPEEELILAIGSSQASYTMENPFTAAERFEMITGALRGGGILGCVTIPLPDVGRHSIWVAHAEELLPPFGRVYTNNPLTRLLFEKAGYAVEAPTWVDRDRFEGRQIRAAIALDRGWEDRVPPEVAEYLRSIHAPERLRHLAGPSGHGSLEGG